MGEVPGPRPRAPEVTAPGSAPAPAGDPSRLPAWLQFPRRALLLLLAYGLAVGGLLALRGPLGRGAVADWSVSAAGGQPVADIIGGRAAVTLALLAATLLLAAPLAALGAALSTGLRRLRAAVPAAGMGAGCVVRLLVYGLAVLPPFVLGLLLIVVLVLRLRLIPLSVLLGTADEAAAAGLGLALLALLLALFPALAAAQAAAETLARPATRGRRLAAASLTGLGALWLNTGGLLSALVPLELVLGRPGLGRLVVDALIRRDAPLLLGLVLLFVTLSLAGRLLAELFFAAARLAAGPSTAALVPAPAAPMPLRRAGLAAGLALLLLPLALLVAGSAVPPGRALEVSPADRNQGPSAEHPWGTDGLGRDVRARALRGTTLTLGLATSAALLATLGGALLGALTGSLARRGRLWSESLADALLLPGAAGLLVPAVPAVVVLLGLTGGPGLRALLLLAALVLLPRAWHAAHALWAQPSGGRAARAGAVLLNLAALVLAVVFSSVWLVVGLEMLGLGVPPPVSTLGGLMADGLPNAAQQPQLLIAPIRALWLAVIGLYAAAAGLLGLGGGKTAAAWLNA